MPAIRLIAVVLVTAIATLLLTVALVNPLQSREKLEKWAGDRGHNALRQNIDLHRAYLNLPRRLLASLKPLPESVPRLTIDIGFRNIQKLREKRQEALRQGILMTDSSDFVPATVRHRGRSIPIKLRLKGDWTEHLRGDKWSFRIHVRDEDHVLGMRRFSLQHPRTRGFQSELLFFESLRELDVLAPRYHIVDVVVNGNHWGLMALEEHFSTELLESNGRRDSVIVRFDQGLLYAERLASRSRSRVFGSFRNARVETFRPRRVELSETLAKDNAVAIGLLRGFIEGYLTAAQAFDVDRLGGFLAAVELWGAQHAIWWENHVFSLNPITQKLEPIGFDADLRERTAVGEVTAARRPFVELMLRDDEVFAAYLGTLRKLARKVLSGDLKARLEEVDLQQLEILRKEFFLLEAFPYEELQNRAAYFDSRLPAEGDKFRIATGTAYPALVYAYLVEGEQGPYVEVSNALPHEVEIQALVWSERTGSGQVEFEPEDELNLPLRLPPSASDEVAVKHRIRYRKPENSEDYSLEVTASIRGRDEPLTREALPYHSSLRRHPLPKSTVEDQLIVHPFLQFDPGSGELLVSSGQWYVAAPLIVPAGFSLTIPPGTSLRFTGMAGLIAYGPLDFRGTKDAPVILEGESKENGAAPWPGVVVLDAGAQSRWAYTLVRNTTGIQGPHWKLTGGITFYASDIYMENCLLQGSLAEDAVNFIHSEIELREVSVENTRADALDGDFVQGSVVGGAFRRIGSAVGGDAIDVSGSVIEVDGASFDYVRDKALSVGEGSRMTADNLSIERARIGAACKDGSHLTISNTAIKNAGHAGLMAYMKKREFGPGVLDARGLSFEGPAPEAIVQNGSVLTLDGEPVRPQTVDLEQLY